jgi:ketosteroid isomerase-like protein
MAHGDLATVEQWLQGVNDADREGVLALTSPDMELVGPRGVGRGHELLADWLARAHFSSKPLRWFCGVEGRIVVEQDATWTVPGGQTSHARVASFFTVRGQRVARFERFDSVDLALLAAGLGEADEVRTRSPRPSESL